MTLHLIALFVLVAGGAATLACGRAPERAITLGTSTTVLGSALGLVSAGWALLGHPSSFTGHCGAFYGEFTIGLDPLTAFFEIALFALAIPAAFFGAGYMRPHLERKSLPSFFCFQNLLIASIALVFSAQNAVLFLVAWEIMTVASFALVAFEHDKAEVRNAGLVFLVASHLGTAFLFALFALLGHAAGSFQFASFAALPASVALPVSALFALTVIGFGTKAGLVPLHVWLPEAHPVAPSHVSALLSGVMIKTGVYGIIRAISWLPPLPDTYGFMLGGLGLLSAVVAILLALGQRDLKRVLAYSSVENVGIIALALGIALAAHARGREDIAAIAWAGALLHVWNHAAMKGLAFMSAGAIAHAVHGRDLERMGGLLSRLPITGTCLLVGLAALCALPPLNGFSSELLVYLGILRASNSVPGGPALLSWLALSGLALVGGLAALAFTRLGGIALLGLPRSAEAEAAREPSPALWRPLVALAALCALLGLAPDLMLFLALPAIAHVGHTSANIMAERLAPVLDVLASARQVGVTLIALAAGIALLLRGVRGRRAVTQSETWSCGFSRPTSRMSYTATSYAELFLSAIAPRALRPRARFEPPMGVLPGRASARFEPRDPARSRLFDPLFSALADRASRLRRYQAQRPHLQLAYTVATLLALALILALRTP